MNTNLYHINNKTFNAKTHSSGTYVGPNFSWFILQWNYNLSKNLYHSILI